MTRAREGRMTTCTPHFTLKTPSRPAKRDLSKPPGVNPTRVLHPQAGGLRGLAHLSRHGASGFLVPDRLTQFIVPTERVGRLSVPVEFVLDRPGDLRQQRRVPQPHY
ncbi:hypothetical protein LAJ19_08770 [Deinococcus taeanensis]|uniref:hypothetical protein n=1 Tax=Deinococcus taeanensis TaxID=2737050 RepID=UPI001CDC399A|nr:hypothetical protein [Deinococcus taeanensis]UBV41744.1 hypothetical protein LAJ19_08770 [Deinococcus taeanensis]